MNRPTGRRALAKPRIKHTHVHAAAGGHGGDGRGRRAVCHGAAQAREEGQERAATGPCGRGGAQGAGCGQVRGAIQSAGGRCMRGEAGGGRPPEAGSARHALGVGAGGRWHDERRERRVVQRAG